MAHYVLIIHFDFLLFAIVYFGCESFDRKMNESILFVRCNPFKNADINNTPNYFIDTSAMSHVIQTVSVRSRQKANHRFSHCSNILYVMAIASNELRSFAATASEGHQITKTFYSLSHRFKPLQEDGFRED